MPGILSRLNATIYCRIREAITRQQGVPTSLYRSSALPLCSLTSSHTLHTKSMITASHSNAMLGDVYAYGLISGRGSVRDFTKPAVGCLRGSVNLRRLQPLYGPLSFGCSTFDANRRIRDSSLLHGSWLKNFSASSSACYSAGAAHAVSFDGSPPDEQLANSSFSPDPWLLIWFQTKVALLEPVKPLHGVPIQISELSLLLQSFKLMFEKVDRTSLNISGW
ncbi:hypothetical protein JHK82_039999 [Glycine max]|nr:hypothetical protein JHK82_039999 [Glycine max]KAG5122072.1 hypothetical protein JHK84_040412 [Glycine max]